MKHYLITYAFTKYHTNPTTYHYAVVKGSPVNFVLHTLKHTDGRYRLVNQLEITAQEALELRDVE